MLPDKQTPEKTHDVKVLEILDRLDLVHNETTTGKPDGRWRYRRSQMSLTVEHPAGGISRCYCHARQIWREGIALLTQSFCYPKSEATLVLVSVDGDLMSIRATVESCRHTQGGYHEMELRFTQKIDPTLFVESSGPDKGPIIDRSSLRARIAYLDDSEADAKLLAHHFKQTGIALTWHRHSAEALEALRQQAATDIFLCDLNLGREGESSPVIRQARANGFAGPIVVVTAETHPDRLAAAKAAGADSVLHKPFNRDALMNFITGLHETVGAIAGDPIYSSLSDQPDVEELLNGYIAEAKTLARTIDDAINADDLNEVRTLCLSIKGSAAGYGFAPLTGAADAALRMLDATMGIPEARPKLRALTLMLNQLVLKPSKAAASATTDPQKQRMVS